MKPGPSWHALLFAIGASVVGVWLAVALAQEHYAWPALLSASLALFLLARWQPFPIGTVLLGGALVGYIVGNRGFAQLLLSSKFPLLPAEAVLLIGGGLLLAQAALRRELPLRRDPLNLLLLAWLVAGTVRVAFDVRLHGFMALRDYALVYYAGFFYLAQEAARDARGGRALLNTTLAAAMALPAIHLLFQQFPDFFLGTLTVRGAPLIYYKGDLVGTFAAVGAVLAFLRFEEHGHRRWVVVSLALAGTTLASGNRASMLGLLVAAGWLAIGRRWRFAAVLGVSGMAAAIVILTVAAATKTSWEKTPLFGVYERAVSLIDPTGQRTYRGENSATKGDNNIFRTVWWKAVIDETMEENPYTGLGFGHDIADRFARVYYPEGSEEFSARSPHNVLLTIFARMGAVGLLLFLSAMSVVAVRTWRAIRAGPEASAPWCAAWVILISACFGVVLEGPMGAVVFWTLLGVAHASSLHQEPESGVDVLEPETRSALADAEKS
jgi:O-antigen ligase